ncbi:sigma-70 family RNA polymerase sigma factor [bacterium]|nr:sigma-70 family RNA polymerase sigma factor [bacterium]
MNQPTGRHTGDAAAIAAIIAGVAAGDHDADVALHALLRSPVIAAVRGFLGADDLETDDIAQDTMLVAYRYIRDGGGFTGDIVALAVTVARNRCRSVLARRRRRRHVPLEDAQDRVPDPRAGPAESLLSADALATLREGIARLGTRCRALLWAFYVDEKPMEEIRALSGLKTVQGVYYRRQVCLRELAGMLAGRL